VIGDNLRRCVAHQGVTAEELLVMRFGHERWFKKKWLKEPKAGPVRPPKWLSDEQVTSLQEALAEEENEAEEFYLLPPDLFSDLVAETAVEQQEFDPNR
jgi:hypothetical protein